MPELKLKRNINHLTKRHAGTVHRESLGQWCSEGRCELQCRLQAGLAAHPQCNSVQERNGALTAHAMLHPLMDPPAVLPTRTAAGL